MSNNFEEYVLEKLDHLEEKFKQNDKFQTDVYERFDKSDARIDKIEHDMSDMKNDISNLKTDVSNMKKDISFMKEDMSFMQRTMLSMQQTMENMNRSIILIEHKVTTEIPTLFDGYSMHQEKQKIQQENIDSLNVKVKKHDIRISSLEQAIV